MRSDCTSSTVHVRLHRQYYTPHIHVPSRRSTVNARRPPRVHSRRHSRRLIRARHASHTPRPRSAARGRALRARNAARGRALRARARPGTAAARRRRPDDRHARANNASSLAALGSPAAAAPPTADRGRRRCHLFAARSAGAAGCVSARYAARRRVERHLNACLRRGESRPQGVSFREEVSWVGGRLLAENDPARARTRGQLGGLLPAAKAAAEARPACLRLSKTRGFRGLPAALP